MVRLIQRHPEKVSKRHLYIADKENSLENVTMQNFRQIFFRGLITLLPIALTIYILYAGLLIVENVLGSFLRTVIPPEHYIPGYGFFATVLLIFLFGLLLNNLVIKSVLGTLEKKLSAVPLIKTIYSPLKDLMNLFSKKEHDQIKSVVFVQFAENGPRALGLVTRESFKDIAAVTPHTQDRVAVFFPLSYGLGGFTMLGPKTALMPVDIPIEKAMTLAITGWVKTDQNAGEKNG
jgi:uncharacterized membrane protein